ncbi:MAG: TA system VapC family ribonuclease toxin [Acidobacteriota bacterium]
MTALLDVNLLVALAWPNHVHHASALTWFRRNQAAGWATCPLTQSGFVRVSSNPACVSEAKSPQEAIQLLRRIVALPHHVFWGDDISFASSEFLDSVHLVGYRQVTDAHLLALAQNRGGRLATLDGRIRGLVPRGHNVTDVVHFVER